MTSRLFTALAAVLLLGLVGCDTADTDSADLDATNAAIAEAEAVSIVNALAIENGGALASLGDALALGDEARGGHAFGCERSRTYSETAQLWTQSVDCERGDADGAFYLAFARTRQVQFLDADGAPQMLPADAETMLFDIVEGSGERRTPVFEHVLNDIGGAFTVTDFSDDLVTVNGEYARAATNTYERRRAVRTFDYALDLTFVDVVTPRRMHVAGDQPEGPHGGHGYGGQRFWFRAESGRVEGTLTGTMTVETASGVRTRQIDRAFVVTFGEANGEPVATIRVGEYTFEANPTTGEIEGVES